MHEYRYNVVTWRQLKIGDTVEMWKTPGGSIHFISATVKGANAANVTLLHWGVQEETVSSEDTLFYVKLSEEDFRAKYMLETAVAARMIQNKIRQESCGNHTIKNAWCDFTSVYDFAAACEQEHLIVMGHFILPTAKNAELDIGIVCQTDDHQTIWCHASSKKMNQMLAKYYDERQIQQQQTTKKK